MLEHMTYIVCEKHRPFSYRDFISFEVNGKNYGMKHGTFRNKASILKRCGKLELLCNSALGFYTLKGHTVPKPMTSYRAGVTAYNNPLFDFILGLPYGNNSIHNVRLSFKVNRLWPYFSDSNYAINGNSKDIRIGAWRVDDLFIRVVVHKSDTVTVNIGCSYQPIVVDISGIIILSNALTRVEERISSIIKNANDFMIPHINTWIVTMWHFGRDSIAECGKSDFHMAWKDAENVLIRAYSKIARDGKNRARIERQEYPNKTVLEAFEDKLQHETHQPITLIDQRN
jgi:hypothetical protein